MPEDLTARMYAAADVLEHVARMYDAFVPDEYPITAAWLRHEAEKMEVPF